MNVTKRARRLRLLRRRRIQVAENGEAPASFIIHHSSFRIHSFLERYLVVFYVVASGRGTTAATAAAARGPPPPPAPAARAPSASASLPPAAATASASGLPDGDALHVSGAAVEELNLRGVDFESLSRLALAVSPLLHVQAAFDVDPAPLREVLRGGLGLLAPCGYAEPRRDVLLLARLVAAALVRRDRELADGRALRRVAQLRVAPEVPDDVYLVVRHFASRSYRFDAGASLTIRLP